MNVFNHGGLIIEVHHDKDRDADLGKVPTVEIWMREA